MNQWGKRWKWAAAVSIVAVLGLTGCSGKEADASATLPQETAEMTEAETTRAEIEIHQETTKAQPEELDYYRPEERIEENGKIRSYLTGELVDAKQGNRRPLAVMMSNDKQAQPQYGLNRAGVVYEAPVEGTMNRYMALIEEFDDLDRFFIVLDLRLTKVGARRCSFFYIYRRH